METSLFTLQATARLSDQDAAAIAGKSLYTWREYKAHRQPVPQAVIALFQCLAGTFPWPGWHGWKVWPRDGLLYVPGMRDGISQAEIQAIPWTRQLVRFYQAQDRRRPQAQAEAFPPIQLVR